MAGTCMKLGLAPRIYSQAIPPPSTQCTRFCLNREGMKKAGVQLLEPIMRVEVLTPDEHMGDVIGNLNSRRGVVQDFEDKPGAVKASVLWMVACGCVRALVRRRECCHSRFLLQTLTACTPPTGPNLCSSFGPWCLWRRCSTTSPRCGPCPREGRSTPCRWAMRREAGGGARGAGAVLGAGSHRSTLFHPAIELNDYAHQLLPSQPTPAPFLPVPQLENYQVVPRHIQDTIVASIKGEKAAA